MKRVCLLLLAAATTAATAPAASAQMASRAVGETVERMRPLEMMVGEWIGRSTTRTGPDSEQTVNVRESARWSAGGEVLVVEGHGWQDVEGETRVVHDALGAISYDADAAVHRMRSYRAGQGWVDAEVHVEEKRVTWELESPGGTIRFTADYSTPGKWIETGEIRRGGEWRSFLRMELERVE